MLAVAWDSRVTLLDVPLQAPPAMKVSSNLLTYLLQRMFDGQILLTTCLIRCSPCARLSADLGHDEEIPCGLQGRSPGQGIDDGLLRSVMGLRGRTEESSAPPATTPNKIGDRAASRIAAPQVVAEWDAERPVIGLHWLSSVALAAACELGPHTRVTLHDPGGLPPDGFWMALASDVVCESEYLAGTPCHHCYLCDNACLKIFSAHFRPFTLGVRAYLKQNLPTQVRSGTRS